MYSTDWLMSPLLKSYKKPKFKTECANELHSRRWAAVWATLGDSGGAPGATTVCPLLIRLRCWTSAGTSQPTTTDQSGFIFCHFSEGLHCLPSKSLLALVIPLFHLLAASASLRMAVTCSAWRLAQLVSEWTPVCPVWTLWIWEREIWDFKAHLFILLDLRS